MQRTLEWMVISMMGLGAAGCGGPAAQSPASASTPPSAVIAPSATQDVESIAVEFARAAMSGDGVAARAHALTYEQLAAISDRTERADFEAELADTLEQLAREGREHPSAKLIAAHVVERKTLPANAKRRIDTEYAALVLTVEQDGQTHDAPIPLVFLHTDAGWKLLPKR
jgi:hypothetical protein